MRKQKGSEDFGLSFRRQIVVDAELLDQAVDNAVKVSGLEVQEENTYKWYNIEF